MPIAPVDRVFFPFVPDWNDPFRVKFEFRTTMFTNEAGGEQRWSMRTTPRISLTFKIQLIADELRRWNRLVDTAQNLPVMVPDFSRSVLTTSIPVGAVVNVNEVPWWLVNGREISFASPNMEPRSAVVNAVLGNQVTFATAPTAWPVGTSIYPVLTGELQPDINGIRVTNGIAEIPIEFDCEPASEIFPDGVADIAHASREFFAWTPNWTNNFEVNHIWPVEKVDFGRGLWATYRDVDFPTSVRSGTYIFDIDQAFDMLQFFLRAKGQRGEFLHSSGEHDIVPMLDLVNGNNTLTIQGRDFFDAYNTDPVRQHFEVYYGATSLLRAITGMAVVSGNTVITVDTPWPANISRDSVSRISWTINSRFATDTLEFEWLTDRLARAKISIRSLPMVASNDYTALRATLAGDDRETLVGDDREVIYL